MNASCAPGFTRHGLALAVSLAVVLMTPARAFSTQLEGVKDGPQGVTMCSDCSRSGRCVQLDDYRVTLQADLDRPTTGMLTRFTVRLTDRLALPVTDATVTLVLPAADRSAQRQVIAMFGGQDGLYIATVLRRSDPLRDPWKASVFVTTAKGDRVKQRFVLAVLICDRSWR